MIRLHLGEAGLIGDESREDGVVIHGDRAAAAKSPDDGHARVLGGLPVHQLVQLPGVCAKLKAFETLCDSQASKILVPQVFNRVSTMATVCKPHRSSECFSFTQEFRAD